MPEHANSEEVNAGKDANPVQDVAQGSSPTGGSPFIPSSLPGLLVATLSFAKSTTMFLASLLLGLFSWIAPLFPVGILFKCFIAFQILSSFWRFLLAGGESGTTDLPGISGVEQHFKFEQIGYAYGAGFPSLITAPPPSSLTNTSHLNDEPTLDFGRGYYSKDAAALFNAIRNILPYIPPLRRQDNDIASGKVNDTDDVVTNTEAPIDTCTLEKESVPSQQKETLLNGNDDSEVSVADGDTETFDTHQRKPGIVVVLNLRLGTSPSKDGATSFVRDAVTFLIGVHRDRQFGKNNMPQRFEVIIRLQSRGGDFSQYGLLAEQLRRLRKENGITLTVCCDEAALSGGYLLAATASPGQLFATPFASIGSIGVIAKEIINFRPVLERLGIQHFRLHSGLAKEPIGWFGEVRKEQIETMQRRLDSSHNAFRQHVETLRGDLIKDYDEATNGNYWTGITALELGLVDRLVTSDEYIDDRVRSGDRVVKLDKRKEVGLVRGLFGWEGADGFSAVESASSSQHGRLFLVYTLENLSYLIAATADFVATLA